MLVEVEVELIHHHLILVDLGVVEQVDLQLWNGRIN
jgi:hypothetical protein